MPESKTIVFGNDGSSNLTAILASMFNNRGLDPNLVMSMMNNRGNNNGWGEGGSFIWVLFLLMWMFNGGYGNGFGGFGGRGAGAAVAGDAALANLINNNDGRDLIMQAIQGKGDAINQLANTLGCSIGQVQTTLNTMMTQIQNVGNQVGQSSLQIINSIQAGNANIAAQLAQCCCENRLATCEQTNTLQREINNVSVGQERGFSSLAFETSKQTCDITKSIADSTAQILAGQKAAEMRELQREIAERDRKIAEQSVVINNAQQTSIVGQMITQATAPIINAVGTLQKDVDGVKCKLPETTTIPYSPVVGVPSCVAAQYGLGFGLGVNAFNYWG